MINQHPHGLSTLWAINEPTLYQLLQVKTDSANPYCNSHEQTAVTITDPSVAVIPVRGVLLRYPHPFILAGTTSYEQLTHALCAALDNPTVKGIVFAIDSPGGEVNGCSELAQTIYQARGRKPIIAYVAGDAASGAYWLASACDKIIATDTSSLGSIGVIAAYSLPESADDNATALTLVSSQSPYKQLDARQDSHRQRLQQRIDQIAQVFINSVAKYRDIRTEKVINDFGGGDVRIGQQAVDCGLADRMGTLENVMAEIIQSAKKSSPILSHQATKEYVMSEQKNENSNTANNKVNDTPPEPTTEQISQLAAQAQQQERERLAAILNSDVAQGREALAQHLAFKTAMAASDAQAILQAAPVATVTEKVTSHASSSTGFEQVMASTNNPRIEPNLNDDEDNIDAVAKRLAAY
jgi:signal peptide peptidase SppA